jgi:hypothetical protein
VHTDALEIYKYQEVQLAKTIRCARFVFNYLLLERYLQKDGKRANIQRLFFSTSTSQKRIHLVTRSR